MPPNVFLAASLAQVWPKSHWEAEAPMPMPVPDHRGLTSGPKAVSAGAGVRGGREPLAASLVSPFSDLDANDSVLPTRPFGTSTQLQLRPGEKRLNLNA